MSEEIEMLKSGDRVRKQLETFAKSKGFNQADMYIALKLWVFALEQTDIKELKKGVEGLIEASVSNVVIKQ